MPIDTFWVVAFRLEVAGRHPRHLAQRLEIVLGDVVIVIVGAARVVACICAVQVVDIA
jgi:hypothetical protein